MSDKIDIQFSAIWLALLDKGIITEDEMLKYEVEWQKNRRAYKACARLCEAMNLLPGIQTTESCCGHGKSPFRVFFEMDSNSIGAVVFAKCLAEGERRDDHKWRTYIADTDHFLLEGKPMLADGDEYPPAEKLADNLLECVQEASRAMICQIGGMNE